MLQQIFKQPIRQTILVRPCAIAKYACHFFAVCLFDFTESCNDGCADILGYLSDVVPVMALGHNERV